MRILIQGAGSIGQRHYRNAHALGHEAAFLRSTSNRRQFVQKFYDEEQEHGRPVIEFSSLDQACAEWKPEALVVATPNHLHLEHALAAANAGLHILIEKPLHSKEEGLDELEKITTQKNLTALVGYNLRFHPLLKKVHGLIYRGEIGRILSATVEVGEAIEDWHPWEDYCDTYAPYIETGGGALLCFSHDIDYLYWLLGMPNKVVSGGGKVTPLLGNAEDLVQGLWMYADGKTASIHIDYFQRPKVRTLKVIGTEGSIQWDAYGKLIHTDRSTGTLSSEEVPEGFERNDMFIEELRHFVACTEGKEHPLISIREGREVLGIVEQMKQGII